jgi:hypothetical protein
VKLLRETLLYLYLVGNNDTATSLFIIMNADRISNRNYMIFRAVVIQPTRSIFTAVMIGKLEEIDESYQSKAVPDKCSNN